VAYRKITPSLTLAIRGHLNGNMYIEKTQETHAPFRGYLFFWAIIPLIISAIFARRKNF